MKVAYLISRYPAVNHTYILREIRGLRALGMDVRVASILPVDRAAEQLSPEEIEEATATFYVRPLGIVSILASQVLFALGRPGALLHGIASAMRLSRWNLRTAVRHLLYVAEAVVVGRWMERESLHHVHTHFASTTALFLRKMFPVTSSATIHGPAEFIDVAGFLLAEKVAAAEFIVAISRYGADQIKRVTEHQSWGKIHVAHLGVPLAEFILSPSHNVEIEILFVGQLVPAKGLPILLQACASLLQKGHRFRLRVVGDGPLRHSLEALVSELQISASVIFAGALSNHRVREIYQKASLFALASFAEGIPVVLMEAMAMGIPCVATSITGIPELIEHGVSGLLVPPGDVSALAQAIEQLLNNSALRSALGLAGREKVAREFNCAHCIEQLHAIFKLALV